MMTNFARALLSTLANGLDNKPSYVRIKFADKDGNIRWARSYERGTSVTFLLVDEEPLKFATSEEQFYA